ncbi:MAG: hypothetical protein KatS3mg095_0456 [Candidatus Parcubacteria bacterium]|nr:MAG: hypothetical protein KatS3mg095_0456 [Candidatus Parcubacteria bacterium]
MIKGEHTYKIFYKILGGLIFFDNYNELYWNVTGNEWNVPIEKSAALIRLPEKISIENMDFDCFTGVFGSKEKNCNFKVNENGDTIFQSNKTLNPNEGLTIVLRFPKNVVRMPTFF